MKRIVFALTVLFVAGIAAYAAVAQPPSGERGRGGPGGRGFGGPGGPDGFRPPTHPLENALDTNGDHQLSAKEIENAVAAIKALDKNEDGKIGEDELRPRFRFRPDGPAGRERGFGGPEGRRPEGRDADGRGSDEPRRGPDGPPRDRDAGRPGDSDGMLARVLSFDKNDDGKLTKDELPERMQGIIARGDTNGDGALDKEELTRIARSFQGRGEGSRGDADRPAGRGPRDGGAGRPDAGAEGRGRPDGPPGPEMIVNRAMQFDADGDGKLSRDELVKFAHEIGRRRGGPGGSSAGRGAGRGPQDGDRPAGRPQRPTGE